MAWHNSPFTAVIDLPSDSIPIFIPSFNQPTLLSLALEQLEKYDLPIIIHDNNSTLPEMEERLREISKSHQVIKYDRNVGPRLFTEDDQLMSLMPDHYIVTDPDLIYGEMPDNFISELKDLISRNKLAKAGLAIEINEEEERAKFLDPESVDKIEKRYWEQLVARTPSGNDVYDAPIDTTFALNNRDACRYHRKFRKQTWQYPCFRVAGSYTCRHIGWWKKELMPQDNEEIKFYLDNQKWSHTELFYYGEKS